MCEVEGKGLCNIEVNSSFIWDKERNFKYLCRLIGGQDYLETNEVDSDTHEVVDEDEYNVVDLSDVDYDENDVIYFDDVFDDIEEDDDNVIQINFNTVNTNDKP